MSDMRELYQEMILDHHKHPRNFGRLTGANRHAEGFNPLCGDRVTVYALVEGDEIRDLSFEGSGCAICMASASVMTDELAGQTIDDAERLYVRFHDLVTGESAKEPDLDALGKLAVFMGVREFPVRVKCATLPWHALRAALKDGEKAPVSTE
ncbi:MAG TPA: SUF system NifU family Fe-S cluster assembly protein [Candidatus Krumholzibacteria bacterium]|nr:SUF system NifU family Fe-S cluster assembly protein [Candidatus Krumholzibacteria bacterium]